MPENTIKKVKELKGEANWTRKLPKQNTSKTKHRSFHGRGVDRVRVGANASQTKQNKNKTNIVQSRGGGGSRPLRPDAKTN